MKILAERTEPRFGIKALIPVGLCFPGGKEIRNQKLIKKFAPVRSICVTIFWLFTPTPSVQEAKLASPGSTSST